MKRKEKRIVWAILVCIGVFFNMFSGINIVAEEISDASDYSYHILENDMIEITSYQGSETNLNIPSVIDGKTVVKIGEQAFQNSTIESVYVPGTIKEIGTLAFGSCRYLEYVQFNGNAPLINEQAFASVEASVFYPLKNETWVGEMFADYGGTLTWRSKNITMASISELKIRNCEGEVFLSWEADGKVDGFEISYAIVIQAQKVDIPDGEKRTAILQELEQGKTYKVRIRNYINDNSKKIYSLYSEERTIKIPKSHTEISIPGEEATCVKDGKTPGKNCFVCSKILEEQTTIPASHKWEEEYSIDREPSCTQSGEKSIHCENCGEIKEGSQEEIGKSEHKWKEEYSIDREPSCTQNGEKSIHCENCGEIKEGSREEVGKSEHKWKEEYSVDQEPSCTQSGEKSIHCKDCGEIKEGSQEEIGKSEHKWKEEYSVDREPSCTQSGEKSIHCKNCGEMKEGSQEKIEKSEHKWKEEYNIDREPSCTQNGEKSIHCENCGEIKEGSQEEVGKSEHKWKEEYSIDREPSCTQNGEKSIHCKDCGEIKEGSQEEVGKSEHKWKEEYSVDQEPSCTQSGEKSIHCKDCGEIKEGSQEEIGKSEHKWKEEYSVDREPSCTQSGEKSIHCKDCGEIKEGSREEIGKSEHKWKEEYSVDQEPSCTQSGEKSIHCENCGEIKEGSQEEIEKILHKWDVGKVTKSPTATQKGIKVYTCIVCNGTREESILETGVPVKGTMLKVNNNIYKIKKAGKLKGEVIFVKASKNKKSLIIPSTIKTAGITYKVTSIGAGAFKNNKKITKITIGLSVTSIGKEAFKGCNRLSRIIIRSKKLKFVGKNALKNINSSATIKVPRNKLSSYKTLFKNKGQRKKVKIKK